MTKTQKVILVAKILIEKFSREEDTGQALLDWIEVAQKIVEALEIEEGKARVN